EIAAIAAGRQQRASRLRMIRLALAQKVEFGREFAEHLLAMEALAFGFLGIEAEHIAAAALALANHDLLDLAHRHGQDIAAETARERRHVLGRIHAGIADEHTAAEPGPADRP